MDLAELSSDRVQSAVNILGADDVFNFLALAQPYRTNVFSDGCKPYISGGDNATVASVLSADLMHRIRGQDFDNIVFKHDANHVVQTVVKYRFFAAPSSHRNEVYPSIAVMVP